MTPLHSLFKKRRTAKVLGDPQNPLPPRHIDPQVLDDLLLGASEAPFHYPANQRHTGELTSPAPWRFYKLDAPSCRALMARLEREEIPAGKIANMLAVADFLVLTTWLPEEGLEFAPTGETIFSGSVKNMEHIAAASSATYGLLLGATEEGFQTYWSSGGPLATRELFQMVGVPEGEILLGAVFLFPQEVGEASIKPGAWADRKGEVESFSRWLTVT